MSSKFYRANVATLVALFQQSVDTCSETHIQRGMRTRVSFGERWVKSSIMEIFRDDGARFRTLVGTDLDEDPMALLDKGKVPQLKALRLHNGTIYRWTRPCYGISEGKPHLRIENRILPSGPTILDEIANAAFWYGLLAGLSRIYPDIRTDMEFDAAHENFLAAARLGLRAQFSWPGHHHIPADELILKELLPMGRENPRADRVLSTGANSEGRRRFRV